MMSAPGSGSMKQYPSCGRKKKGGPLPAPPSPDRISCRLSYGCKDTATRADQALVVPLQVTAVEAA